MTAHEETNESKDTQKDDCMRPESSVFILFQVNLLQADGIMANNRPRQVDFDARLPEQFGAVTSFVLSCPEHLRSGSEYSKSFVLSVEVCKL
jgi:hypothetical protein